MVKEGGGAVILRLTSAQYFSGMPTALSSESFLCLISSSLRRLQHTHTHTHRDQLCRLEKLSVCIIIA